ncbi:unnamed protein product [Pipistrellus nathusii]|uniref:Uncharacterized protein n=1 Tax=Pipistrellus nathusii TaxID=59473 RepID=A0ABN9Z4A6_PIPNA
MAENLRKLVSNDFLRTMYENLERWQRDYNVSGRRGGAWAGCPSGALHSPPPPPALVRPGVGGPVVCKAPVMGIPNQPRTPDAGKEGPTTGVCWRRLFFPRREVALRMRSGVEL